MRGTSKASKLSTAPNAESKTLLANSHSRSLYQHVRLGKHLARARRPAHLALMPIPTPYKSADRSRDMPQSFERFREIEHWVFDLDNTLYAADVGLLKTIEQRICLFVQRELALEYDAAWKVQKDYFHQYGTTLTGLMIKHGTDPEHYLSFVNDVALDFPPDPHLRAGLERLPGRRVVFTSNCGRHAERVLERLGITHLFDDIFDMRKTGFAAKPMQAAYDAALKHGVIPSTGGAMFDDLPANLEIPASLGMTTIWLRPQAQPGERPAHIHFETDHLAKFLHAIEVSDKK
jgi:putative hydrolase of the HAD superfamily